MSSGVQHSEAACDLADAMEGIDGVEVLTPHFFNEFAFRTPKEAGWVLAELDQRGVLGGIRASRLVPGAGFDDVIIAAATECCTADDIAAYAAALTECTQ